MTFPDESKSADKRRDELAKRILNTPPLQRDQMTGKKPNPPKEPKRTAGKGRARVGKAKG